MCFAGTGLMKGGGGEKTCSALQLKKANVKMNKGRDMLLFEALHKRCCEDKRIDGVAPNSVNSLYFY